MDNFILICNQCKAYGILLRVNKLAILAEKTKQIIAVNQKCLPKAIRIDTLEQKKLGQLLKLLEIGC